MLKFLKKSLDEMNRNEMWLLCWYERTGYALGYKSSFNIKTGKYCLYSPHKKIGVEG